MFVYTVEQEYLSIKDGIFKILEKMKCKTNCATCRDIPNKNIHYEGHIIKYLDSKYNIDRLPIGIVLLDDLKKVGWVVL